MNIYGKISEYFLKNKKLSFLIFIGIILWGSISFVIMPKQYNPDIVAPAFSVDVEFEGATVDEVYQIVTKPLEDILAEIPSIENIYSKSIQGGKSSVIVEFFVGENLEESMIILRQKISSRLNLSPLGVSDPYIYSIDPEDLPIKTVVLYSNDKDPVALRKIAYQLRDELKQVKGTSLAEVAGGRKREFQIVLDPLKMSTSQTSLIEIMQALNNTSLLKDLGLVKTKDKYFKVETQEQVVGVKDIENIIIASNYEKSLKVSDVATVIEKEKEYEDYVNFYKKGLNLDNAVFLSISKQKGKNIINVSNDIDSKLADLVKRRDYLKGINIEIVKDEGRIAKEEISGLTKNLIQAIAIVFFVLFCFLNHRAALIVAFSIPMTLLTVLALGNLFGYTINRITLFALILSLGLLVDSATVVIENIVKNKKKFPELDKISLVSQSVSEVGTGLFLSTLTTVLAFIPMAFVTGMMGPYMGPLPFFVSAALIVSLIYAYTMNPWLAGVFCKDKIESSIEQKCGVICNIMRFVLERYKSILSGLIDDKKKRFRFLLGAFVILLIVLTFPVIKLVRFRMLPKADREQIYVYMDLDRGISIESTNAVSNEASNLLLKEKDILSIQSFVGIPPVLDFNGLFRGVQERKETNQITLKLNLTHPNKRVLKSEELAYEYRELLEGNFKENKSLRIKVVEDPPGPPVKSTFYVKVKSRNKKLLYSVAGDIEKISKEIEGVKDIDVSSLEEHKKHVLSIDKDLAAKLKVSVESISNELETIFSGKIIGVYHSDYNYEQEYIVLKFDRDLRDSIKDLENINIQNELGNYIPVSRFIKVESQLQEDIILNDNREQVIYISGEMGKRSVTYAAIDLLKKLSNYKVFANNSELTKFSLVGAEYLVNETDVVKIEIGGEWDLTVKVFRDLGLAIAVAIILIYLVLVAQFNSFVLPLLILGTIPLALIGVMPGFAILFIVFRVYFSATSMIGVIALAGIVVNNAIIFIEYVIQAARDHSSLKSTLLDAGVTRARPILLTSITTILGSLVIASDPVWSGLAWSIVFGLSLSSVLTLVVFPVLVYQFLGDKWFNNILER
ncbi:MAG: efflux RND transporter permease subunit [Candidatus Zapsychrus exili]|nr:efflux RND transporter permease subunit [Candidatus Zapsychrus exili]